METRLLLTGATGYIGGSVLSALLNSTNPMVSKLIITAPVRKREQEEVLRAKGVYPVLFRDLDDSEFLTKLASEHDIVIHAASGFHPASAIAMISGLALRQKGNSSKVHYIHTSGTWNLEDGTADATGLNPTEWSDSNGIWEYLQKLESQSSCLQRKTVLKVTAISERENVASYCLMPPNIYGRGKGDFNQQPLYMSDLIKGGLESGRPEYVGDGSGGVGNIHIDDLAALYEAMVSRIISEESIPCGREGMYFAEGRYDNWLDTCKLIGEIGYRSGHWKLAEPVSITVEEAAKKWQGWSEELVKTNFCLRNKTIPDLAKTCLRWEPKKASDQHWHDFMEDNFKAISESSGRE